MVFLSHFGAIFGNFCLFYWRFDGSSCWVGMFVWVRFPVASRGVFLAIFACFQAGFFSLLSALPFRLYLLAKGFGAFDAVFLPVGCNANRDMAADTACIRDGNSNYLGI